MTPEQFKAIQVNEPVFVIDLKTWGRVKEKRQYTLLVEHPYGIHGYYPAELGKRNERYKYNDENLGY